MTISDAELTAMYGRGLHPDTAARVIGEVRALRKQVRADLDVLRAHAARIAEVEAERDALSREYMALRTTVMEMAERGSEDYEELLRYAGLIHEHSTRAEGAESRLAAVLALCDEGRGMDDNWTLSTSEVRAAAQGEDDRPATRGHQHEEWMLDDSAKGGKYCRACGEHIGEGDRG